MSAIDRVWHLMKSEMYFPRKDGMDDGSSAGTYWGPEANATTTVDYQKPRWWHPKERKFQADYNNMESEKHNKERATGTEQRIPMTAENTQYGGPSTRVMDDDVRTANEPFTQEERAERGEFAQQGDVPFRRGASQPRTTTVQSDTAKFHGSSNLLDMKGNEIDRGRVDRNNNVMDLDSKAPQKLGGMQDYETMNGVNLAAFGKYGWTDEMLSAEEAENKTPEITSTLAHEGTHAAIDQPISSAVAEGELPRANYNMAHEIGAYSGQFAGEEKEVNDRLSYHPSTTARGNKVPAKYQRQHGGEQVKMPRPIESQGDIKQAGEPMGAFDEAWHLIKAPWSVDTPQGTYGKVTGPLYSGGDRINDEFRYWTKDKEEALAYAMYGSAVPESSFNQSILSNLGLSHHGVPPMRQTYPAIKVAPDPGFDEDGNPASFVTADPQSMGYIQDDLEGMDGEFMDEDELYAWIASMMPDHDMTPEEEKSAHRGWHYNDEGDEVAPRAVQPVNALGTTGYYYEDHERDQHMSEALKRLQQGASGKIALPDEFQGQMSTSETDDLMEREIDLADWNNGMEEWERDFIRRNRSEDAELLDYPDME